MSSSATTGATTPAWRPSRAGSGTTACGCSSIGGIWSAGRPWPEALEQALGSCRAVAVFVGPGRWARGSSARSTWRSNARARDAAFPVIPVLLPQADPVLGFLGPEHLGRSARAAGRPRQARPPGRGDPGRAAWPRRQRDAERDVRDPVPLPGPPVLPRRGRPVLLRPGDRDRATARRRHPPEPDRRRRRLRQRQVLGGSRRAASPAAGAAAAGSGRSRRSSRAIAPSMRWPRRWSRCSSPT